MDAYIKFMTPDALDTETRFSKQSKLICFEISEFNSKVVSLDIHAR